ncbi:FAD-dependent oxidoreductase [Streptomyces sp. NPDC058391]|uniref:FAD-dependent oxidoreductase n=1 Tax=Streptomyces sp. NPDC058391 TaxID=3346476 RepID=UPI003663DA9D
MNATAAQQHEVLVLGAGYAGLSAAIQLAARTRKRGDLRVTLVNPYDTFTERLRLHMTATGQETAEMNLPELLDGTGAGFVRGWVTAVDTEAKTVRIDDDRVLRYDTLVYGLGSVADTVAVPGVGQAAGADRPPGGSESRSHARTAVEVGVHVDTVRTWRGRYADLGLPELADRKRPGRPATGSIAFEGPCSRSSQDPRDVRARVISTHEQIPGGRR